MTDTVMRINFPSQIRLNRSQHTHWQKKLIHQCYCLLKLTKYDYLYLKEKKTFAEHRYTTLLIKNKIFYKHEHILSWRTHIFKNFITSFWHVTRKCLATTVYQNN